jgi:amphi-Trp domain-containing protein
MTIIKTKKRDVEKTYTTKEFIEKLRRLADCLEKDKPFDIQIAGERVYVPGHATVNIEHERDDQQEEIEFQIVWNRTA